MSSRLDDDAMATDNPASRAAAMASKAPGIGMPRSRTCCTISRTISRWTARGRTPSHERVRYQWSTTSSIRFPHVSRN